jgi:hypothetical protein
VNDGEKMKEIRKNIRCDLGFGKSAEEILEKCQVSLPSIKFTGLPNPLPTGDHWCVIKWVIDFKRHGPSTFMRMPSARQEFIKKAANALETGGFFIEIVSSKARKFRDDNNLRMQRGKVYAFISLLP